MGSKHERKRRAREEAQAQHEPKDDDWLQHEQLLQAQQDLAVAVATAAARDLNEQEPHLEASDIYIGCEMEQAQEHGNPEEGQQARAQAQEQEQHEEREQEEQPQEQVQARVDPTNIPVPASPPVPTSPVTGEWWEVCEHCGGSNDVVDVGLGLLCFTCRSPDGQEGMSPEGEQEEEEQPAAGGSPVIHLLDVKDEVVECFHSAAQINGERWPCRREMEVGIWHGNKVEEDGVKKLITHLDATLFQYNMRAWSSLQEDIEKYQDKFVFYHMNTSSGSRGLMVVCKGCDKLCRIDWHKSDPDDAPKNEECRRKLRGYFGYGTRSEKMRQRIV